MTPEDEAFNYIEQQAKQRKEAVLQALHDENERIGLYKYAYGERPSREQLMAEVAILTELVRVLTARITELEGKV
jgi:plasmid stabilization system protein ParE